MPAVIVRQRKPWRRKDGVFMYFEGEGCTVQSPLLLQTGLACIELVGHAWILCGLVGAVSLMSVALYTLLKLVISY